MLCNICGTDLATEKHHTIPRCKGGKATIECCSDCGGQIHMLFNNVELAKMTLSELLSHNKLTSYIKWKIKHPGEHRHRMSKEVKRWKQYHR